VLLDGSSKMTLSGPEGTASTSVSMSVQVVSTSDAIYNLPSDNEGQFLQTLTIDPGVEYKVIMSASASASRPRPPWPPSIRFFRSAQSATAPATSTWS
jgi:hypothetical protein